MAHDSREGSNARLDPQVDDCAVGQLLDIGASAHYARAQLAGIGMVMTEVVAVEPRGRISHLVSAFGMMGRLRD
jgi:hypothetical protein